MYIYIYIYIYIYTIVSVVLTYTKCSMVRGKYHLQIGFQKTILYEYTTSSFMY